MAKPKSMAGGRMVRKGCILDWWLLLELLMMFFDALVEERLLISNGECYE